MTGVLFALMKDYASEADCFVGPGAEHRHTREQVLVLAPHYYLVSAKSALRTGDRIWLRDTRERIVQHQVSGDVLLLHTVTDGSNI